MSVEIETKRCRPSPDRHLKGQKPPLKPKEVWAIRIRLELAAEPRNLELFNLAIDNKLRACDLVAIKVEDVCLSGRVRDRALIIQRKNRATSAIRDHRSDTALGAAGSMPANCTAATFFRAAIAKVPTCPDANLPGSSMIGSSRSGLIPPPLAPIPRAGARRHKSTGRPATHARVNFCLAIQSSKAP